MRWQDYQEAVSNFYNDISSKGTVHRNLMIPDIHTGQHRQIDTLLIINDAGHEIRIVIDAKFEQKAIDVKKVESVYALACAVGGNKAVIVASNGWTTPAERKAKMLSLDLVSLTESEAYEYLGESVLEDCPGCGRPVLERGWEDYWISPDDFVTLTEFYCSHNCGYEGYRCEECSSEFELSGHNGDEELCRCNHIWRYHNGKLVLSEVAEQ